jgi:hypothetical protein
LESKAGQDEYRFSLSAVESVALTGVCAETSGYLSWQLVKDDGSGAAVTSSSASTCPSTVIGGLPAGDYRLIVKPTYERIGAYQLSVLVVPSAEVFALGDLSGGVTVAAGAPAAGAGVLETVVSQDELRFSLDSRQNLVLDFAGSAFNPVWRLLRADGTVVVWTYGEYRVEGLPAGDYRLVLGTATSIGAAGAYKLSLTTGPAQVFDLGALGAGTVSISDGSPAPGAGRLETKAAQDDYRFSLSSTQSVAVTMACPASTGTLTARLTKDGSSTLIAVNYFCYSQLIPNLPPGDYRLAVQSTYDHIGAYQLGVLVVPDPQVFQLGVLGPSVAVADGTPAAGAGVLETVVSQDELRFSLDSMQSLLLDFTGSAFVPNWQLLRADGTVAAWFYGSNYRVEGLPAGDYRLVLGTNTSIGTAGTYKLDLQTRAPS